MNTNMNLERSTPEQQGVKSEAILKFIQRLEGARTAVMDQDIHSFMLLRHGYVIAEGWWNPYRSELPHVLFSLSKSFTSTAIGFAVQEGLITVQDKVVSYFREECQNPGELLAKMRIHDLLSMSTGHIVDTTDFMMRQAEGNWVKGFFEVPVEKEPGTHFLYNTGATYMLSVIVQRVTGLKVIDYLKPRLFDLLGIRDAAWDTCPMGYNTGGFGLHLKTEDIAKFGQMYLNKGKYHGQQIISEEWIHQASSFQVSNAPNPETEGDWGQGYGYQFWRCRHDAFRGDGAFGQYCVVMPDQDMVLAVTGGRKDLQLPLTILWEELLGGLSDISLQPGLEYDQLQKKLESLALLLPEGKADSPICSKLSGKCYQLEENEEGYQAVRFEFDPNGIVMSLTTKAGELQAEVGYGEWKETMLPMEKSQERAAFSGAWQQEQTLLIQCRFIEAPFGRQFRFTFEDSMLKLEMKDNLGFEDTKWNTVMGKL